MDQTILITGATDGFGKYAAEKLAGRGGTLLLHGRSPSKLDSVRRSLAEKHPGTVVSTYMADFSDLSQVKAMGAQLREQYPELDVLVNNAGIGFGPKGAGIENGVQGYELRFTVNYLAPYLLMTLLGPSVLAARGRVVNVASLGQQALDFDNLMLERGYSGERAYRQSKLALIMATLDMAEAFAGKGATANAIHPATFADTAMTREAGITPMDSVATGGEAIVWLATTPEVKNENGLFFDRHTPRQPAAQALDAPARRLLRKRTEAMLAPLL